MKGIIGAEIFFSQWAALATAHMNIGDRRWLQTRAFLGGHLTKSGKLSRKPRRKGGR
jgi:hypothetical protein